jgi:hypothetical protein
VIREPLKTLSAALDVLLPRLQPNADVKGVSVEDQQSFVSQSAAVGIALGPAVLLRWFLESKSSFPIRNSNLRSKAQK